MSLSSPAVFALDEEGRRAARPFRMPRRAIAITFSIASLAVCVVAGLAVRQNTPRTAAIGYLCESVALLGCAAAFWRHALRTTGLLRVRWFVMVAALVAVGIGYAESGPDIAGYVKPMLRPWQVGSFTTGEALFLLAIVLFFSGVSRSIVLLDVMQALLLGVLRFSLTYTPTTSDHFTDYHLFLSQVFALFLFLGATIAVAGAATASERRFLRLLSWFFGLRFIGFFLSDQVSYIWLHKAYCSVWDLPFTVAMAGSAVYLMWAKRMPETAAAGQEQARRPSLVVRSLMPSFLALANLLLALMVLKISMTGAALSVLFTVVAYVARTTLLQSHAFRERAQLESRNELLEGLATRDHLTGIGNRRSLAGVYAGLEGHRGGGALLLMDIDHFKRANDLRGHLYGDQVLIALARTMEAVGCRVQGSHCARFGGDEFALLLPGTEPERAVVLAEDVRRAFAAHAFEAGDRGVSISLGVYLLDEAETLPLEAVVACADAALYRAKTLGRDRVEVYVAHRSGVMDVAAVGRPALQRAG